MLKVSIHSVGMGQCSLNGKEGDGVTVAFEGEQPAFLTWRSFTQIVNMKARQLPKPEQKPVVPAIPVGNGAPVVK